MERLNDLVRRAQAGDLTAFAQLVEATHAMVFAVTLRVLRDRSMAEDATQETCLRSFRALTDLHEAAAFLSWLRRIAITVALNQRRARRMTFLQLDDADDVPVLDEAEAAWTKRQRGSLPARCFR